MSADKASAPANLERLAYSIQSLADATDLSYETVRQAVLSNHLVARFSGKKAVILREDAMAWLMALPDQKAKAS